MAEMLPIRRETLTNQATWIKSVLNRIELTPSYAIPFYDTISASNNADHCKKDRCFNKCVILISTNHWLRSFLIYVILYNMCQCWCQCLKSSVFSLSLLWNFTKLLFTPYICVPRITSCIVSRGYETRELLCVRARVGRSNRRWSTRDDNTRLFLYSLHSKA